MPVAQVIQFDERQIMSKRRAPAAQMGVILQFPRPSANPALPPVEVLSDEDRAAGRGRDPG